MGKSYFFFLRERLVGTEKSESWYSETIDMEVGLELEIQVSLLYGWCLKACRWDDFVVGRLFWRLLQPGSKQV